VREEAGTEEVISTSVFQAPQSPHCPAHYGASAPQSLQLYNIFAFAMLIRVFIEFNYLSDISMKKYH